MRETKKVKIKEKTVSIMKKFITPTLTIVAMQSTEIIAASNGLDINIEETYVNPDFGVL